MDVKRLKSLKQYLLTNIESLNRFRIPRDINYNPPGFAFENEKIRYEFHFTNWFTDPQSGLLKIQNSIGLQIWHKEVSKILDDYLINSSNRKPYESYYNLQFSYGRSKLIVVGTEEELINHKAVARHVYDLYSLESFKEYFEEKWRTDILPILNKLDTIKGIYEFGEQLPRYDDIRRFYGKEENRLLVKALVKAPDTIDYLNYIFDPNSDYANGNNISSTNSLHKDRPNYIPSFLEKIKEIYYSEDNQYSDRVNYFIGRYYREIETEIENRQSDLRSLIKVRDRINGKVESGELADDAESLEKHKVALMDHNSKLIPLKKREIEELENKKETYDKTFNEILNTHSHKLGAENENKIDKTNSTLGKK